ncbi:hypothetical protein [Priestia filamentosa]|uniref:hypothetical protein n=1 Tax=Priestia filamentosa TaxID=1402861 RepID=UPI003981B6A6
MTVEISIKRREKIWNIEKKQQELRLEININWSEVVSLRLLVNNLEYFNFEVRGKDLVVFDELEKGSAVTLIWYEKEYLLDNNDKNQFSQKNLISSETNDKNIFTISLLEFEHLKVAIEKGFDWSPALQAAFNSAKNSSRPPMIIIPPTEITLASPVTIYNNITLIGNIRASEYHTHPQITTLETAECTFKFPQSNLSNITISGIEFYGHLGATLFDFQDLGKGHILRYSSIYNCGFNRYNEVFHGRLLGVHFYENYINNGNKALSVSGSDNTIRDNFISVKTNVSKQTSVCTLTYLSLSRFERNFITGIKARCLSTNSCNQVVIHGNWFDLSDTCGIYDVNSSFLIVTSNTFNKLCNNIYEQYDAQVVLFDTSYSTFTSNSFQEQPKGSRTLSFRKLNKGTSHIICKNNQFRNLIVNFPELESSQIDFDIVYGTAYPTTKIYKQGQIYIRLVNNEAYIYLGQVWKKIDNL